MNINDSVLRNEEKAIFKLRELYGKYGYSQFRMSKFEEYDLYVRNKNFLTSGDIITFTDKGGKLLALKPDVTLSIVKSTKDDGGVHKVYYNESVYRSSKGDDSFKEITQVGLECIGDIDNYSIAEVLTLAVKSLKAVSDDFVLDISHLGVVASLLDGMDVPAGMRKKIIECIGEKSAHGVREICAGAGVSPESTDKLAALIGLYGSPEAVLSELREIIGECDAVDQLFHVTSVLHDIAPAGSVRIDFSVTSDISYYNGIVFKGFASGIPEAILSGGQYDLLMKKMGKGAGAIGFAVYPDLLEGAEPEEYDVDTVLLYSADDSTEEVHKAVGELTSGGISVSAQKKVPEKLKYRRIVRLGEGK